MASWADFLTYRKHKEFDADRNYYVNIWRSKTDKVPLGISMTHSSILETNNKRIVLTKLIHQLETFLAVSPYLEIVHLAVFYSTYRWVKLRSFLALS